MLFWKKCLLIAIILTLIDAQNYNPEHTLQCRNINNTWSLQQNLSYLWNIIILHDIDKYTYLVLCPIALIMQIIIITTFVRYKLYHSPPLDIIFGLFIWEIFINISLFSTAIFYTVFSTSQAMPCSFPAFCIIIAFLLTIFGAQQQIYLVYFLIHVIIGVNRSIKRNNCFEGLLKHVAALVVSIAGTLMIWGFGLLGLSDMGICTVTSNRQNLNQLYFPILQVTLSLIFVCFSFITYRYFKKHMPEGQALNKRKYQQSQLINRFVIGMSLILALLSIAMLVLFLNCTSLNPQPLTMIWATVFNLTRVAGFFYLIVVMLNYKKIGNKTKKLFRRAWSSPIMLAHKNREPDDNNTEVFRRRYNTQQIHLVNDFGIKQKMLDIQEQQSQIDFVMITQIMTMLSGISIAYKQYLNSSDLLSPLKSLYFHEQISFNIDSKLIRQYQHEAFTLPRMSLLKGKFTIYAPRIFNELILRDNIRQIGSSFDLIKNFDQIYKIYEQNGGKSGQFFFFTSDSRFIIKTINKFEFKIMLQQLQQFYQYLCRNPQTYIAKIYGMFSIHNKQINQKYYILIMKNIAGCQKQQIIRTYDMKGSTHDRQILRQFEEQSLTQNGLVLKDLDFIRLEHRIQIDHQYSKKMRQQLEADTQFLKGLNIIDYSLLLMRVNWPQPTSMPQFWGTLQRIPSTVYPSEYYQICLIDYLQKWDFKKKGQKWWKNLFGKKDTSAQQPSVYQRRFMKFIRQITACDSIRGTQTDIVSSKRETEMAKVERGSRKTFNVGNMTVKSMFQ